jgi:hypothetical protein
MVRLADEGASANTHGTDALMVGMVSPSTPARGRGSAITPPQLSAAVVPFALPAAHFAAALLFFAAGSLGLVWVAPDLAAGRFLMPRVVAVAHLFTLGWITTSIMGALYQLLPVVLGTTARWPGLAHYALLLYAPGLALFTAGMVLGSTGMMLPGAAAFACGLLIFTINVGAGLVGASRRDTTWWTVAAALVFLLVTIILGASLAGNLRWFYLGERRLLALAVHMHVALGGWVLLLVTGVARKLLPMFLLSHGASEVWGTSAAVLLAGGAATLTIFHHVDSPAVVGVSAVLLASGTAAFVVQVILYLRHGRRPSLDAGLRLAASGVAFLACSLILGVLAVLGGFTHRGLTTAYGVSMVVGAFPLFVAGHYYKILPFLVWNRYFAPLVGRGRSLPKVADLFDGRTATVAAMLLAAGAAALVAATIGGQAAVARGGALLFAAGALTVTVQMVHIFRARPQP